MKASNFPSDTKGFDLEKKVFYTSDELFKLGLLLTPSGLPYWTEQPLDIVLLRCSGQMAMDGTILFEGDICEFDVPNDFGSVVKKRGVMKWDKDNSRFYIHISSMTKGQEVHIANVKVIGHELLNLELLN